ncbi:hypothetical protein FHW17_004160 [Phyllobacterium sp. P30BS-XVII]|nr:hypothetical protein [Phyllobacterium sp. P30BS-XVII]
MDSRSRRWLNPSPHSKVANSTVLKVPLQRVVDCWFDSKRFDISYNGQFSSQANDNAVKADLTVKF